LFLVSDSPVFLCGRFVGATSNNKRTRKKQATKRTFSSKSQSQGLLKESGDIEIERKEKTKRKQTTATCCGIEKKEKKEKRYNKII
jgi:hypothetical protein